MQKNMHFYAVFYLSAAAGLDAEKAYIIAYSSQYVDDAKWGRKTTLIFKDRSTASFEPVRTAHNGFESMGSNVQEKVYYPFHFLPGATGEGFEKSAVTRAGQKGELFMPVLREALKSGDLYRTGICLHVLADTFSHDGFSGLWSVCNHIADVTFVPIEKNAAKAIFSKFIWDFKLHFAYLMPPIGHGRAGKMPDISQRSWGYQSYDRKYPLVCNQSKFYKGMCLLYTELIKKIDVTAVPRVSENQIYDTLWKGIHQHAGLKNNIKYWKKQIRSIAGIMISEKKLAYDPAAWEKEIGKWRKQTPFSSSRFYLKTGREGFQSSHFARFHKAALKHRQSVLLLLKEKLDISKAPAMADENMAPAGRINTVLESVKDRQKINAGVA